LRVRAQPRVAQGCARTGFLVALWWAGFSPAQCEPLAHLSIGVTAPAFSAKGADGRQHSLQDYAGKIIVLEWMSPVCPFTAVKYDSGAMQALQSFAAAKKVVWLSIDTAAADRAGYLTPTAGRDRLRKTGAIVTQLLFDTDTRIGHRYGAKTTPSFFIIDRHGKLAYQGAMDDENSDARGRNYVHDALDALLAGGAVPVTETQQRGCAVEY
jgi:alkyl hydroperoxide reductase subunit AhpC